MGVVDKNVIFFVGLWIILLILHDESGLAPAAQVRVESGELFQCTMHNAQCIMQIAES